MRSIPWRRWIFGLAGLVVGAVVGVVVAYVIASYLLPTCRPRGRSDPCDGPGFVALGIAVMIGAPLGAFFGSMGGARLSRRVSGTSGEVRGTVERTPLNAPGPFYVARDQCITCMAPEAEAPSLMAFDEERFSCYFRRQPETADETYRAIRAVWVSCCGAVRYDGSDPQVAKRLADIGLGERVDGAAGSESRSVMRDRATFSYGGEASAEAIVAEIGRQLLASFSHGVVSEGEVSGASASLVWRWTSLVPNAEMELVARPSEDGAGRWMIRLADPAHIGAPSIATSVDDALRAVGRASDIRWYTRDEWNGGRRSWSPLPV